jgi:hypothetical protein
MTMLIEMMGKRVKLVDESIAKIDKLIEGLPKRDEDIKKIVESQIEEIVKEQNMTLPEVSEEDISELKNELMIKYRTFSRKKLAELQKQRDEIVAFKKDFVSGVI